MRRPFAPSTSLTAVSAATTPSSPGLNSATSRLSVGGAGFASVYSGLAMERLWVRIVLLAAATIAAITDALYIVLIDAQGESAQPYVPRFVGGYLAVMAAVVAASVLARPEVVRIRVALRAAGAAGLLVLGILAAFSIGVPLVVAGLLVVFALSRTASQARSRAARLSGTMAAALSIALL